MKKCDIKKTVIKILIAIGVCAAGYFIFINLNYNSSAINGDNNKVNQTNSTKTTNNSNNSIEKDSSTNINSGNQNTTINTRDIKINNGK